MIAPWTKKSFTPAQLLGRGKLETRPPVPLTEEAQEAALALERAQRLHEALKWASGK